MSQTSILLLHQINTNSLKDHLIEDHPNLSHSYSVIFAFQNAILSLLTKLKESHTDENFGNNIYKTIIDEVESKYSLSKMLSVFMGCVNPRSFYDFSRKQIAETETVIARLCYSRVDPLD